MTPVIELEEIRVVHGGRTVLDVPALAAPEREILAVIGPNGAGKSTLLRVLGLLEWPTAGRVRFRGQPLTPRGGLRARRRMAMVFQEPLLTDATVADNVALGLRFRGLAGDRIRPLVAAWLERLGIAGLAHRQARTLSGGEAQRTALARALVLGPELLLLDEPFSALDQPTREAIIEDLGRILREERMTTVLVTHDRAEAVSLGDRLAVLIGGRLLQVDEAAQVFRAPASEEVARFVGVETILDGRVLDRRGSLTVVQAGEQVLEVAQAAEPGEQVRLCLRAEDVTLTPGEPPRELSSARNRLRGHVRRLVPAGPHVRAIIDCGFPLVALITQRSVEDLGLRDGAVVTAHFKATAPHLLRRAGKP
jgi:tungstate transport system ATP-binding protein